MALLALGSCPDVASGFEPGAHVPYLPGSAGGVPIGAIPPPGYYLSTLAGYFEGQMHTDLPVKHPSENQSFGDGLTFLWVPDIELAGARYAAFINQTGIVKTITNIPPHGLTTTQTGLNNTVISPLNLSWELPYDLYVSGRFAFYVQDGQYNRNEIVNIANKFWTFEPNVGISYLKNGLDLSLHLVYDVSTTNTDSNAFGNNDGHYHSGDVFVAEYTASQAFGNWRFGITGYGVQQTNDDRAGGRLVNNSELHKVGMGPLIEYNTKRVGINFYYIRDIVWNRAYGGDVFYFKLTVKF